MKTGTPKRADALSEPERIRRLVERCLGVSVLGVAPLAAGLGARRFYRVRTGGEPATLVARVEATERDDRRPAGAAPEPRLEPLRAFLEAHGLPVPRRYGGDAGSGIDLLEDLGGRDLAQAASEADAAGRHSLYEEVVDLVPRLQALPHAPLPSFERRLDAALFAFKAQLFVAHSLPAALGRKATAAEAAVVGDAFAWIAERAAEAPARLAHRDLQSQNVLLRPGAAPGERAVLIDLQGAFLAPPEYDLVALLRDSYVELPFEEVCALRERARLALPDAPAAESFALRFDLLTLTRKGKDHARFLQAAQAGDDRYLRHLPATTRALREAAARRAGVEPRLARLAELVAQLPETSCAP